MHSVWDTRFIDMVDKVDLVLFFLDTISRFCGRTNTGEKIGLPFWTEEYFRQNLDADRTRSRARRSKTIEPLQLIERG